MSTLNLEHSYPNESQKKRKFPSLLESVRNLLAIGEIYRLRNWKDAKRVVSVVMSSEP